jgi:hypothetical protein
VLIPVNILYNGDMEEEAVKAGSKPKRMRLIWTGFVATALVLVGIICWGIYMTTRVDTRGPVESFAQQHPQNFPLFYPARLPEGFRMDTTSMASLEGTGLSFTLLGANDKKIYITQQRRPMLMEEVNKIREFTTGSGDAYIADLNGRVAGFLVAPETLIIASSPDSTDSTVLRKIIEAMTPLD